MTFKQLEKIIKADGWKLKETKGSHYQYIHKTKPQKVTIPCHGNKDLDISVVNSVLKQAGLK